MRILCWTFVYLFFWTATSGQMIFTGKVTDENGAPLQGASVQILNTDYGTITDARGVYRWNDVELPDGDHTLRVTYVGYQPQESTVGVKQSSNRYILTFQLEKQPVDLDELTVKATRANERTPMTFKTLDRPELEENNLGQDVPYVLRWTPSAVVTSDAGTGIGYTGIRIRGSDPSRINVLINGIPLNDAESQGVFWVNLPDFTTSVDNLQIQRGVGTSTIGVGAFGATINIKTTDVQEKPFARLSNTIGSFNTIKNNIQVGTGLIDDKFAFEGRLSRIESDGFIDRGSANLASYYVKGSYLGEKKALHLTVFSGHEVTYQSWFGVPAQFVDDEELRTFNPAGQKSDGTFHDNQVDDYRQTHVQLHYQQQFSPNLDGQIALHYTRGKGFFEEYIDETLNPFEAVLANYGLDDVILGGDTISSSDLVRRRWLDNNFYGANAYLNWESTDKRWNLTLGGAFSQYLGGHFGEVIWSEFGAESGPDYRYYDVDATKNDASSFLKASYKFGGNWVAFADLQYRFVDYKFERLRDGVEQQEVYNFFNPKIGMTTNWVDNQEAYVSLGVANREPSRFDFINADLDRQPRPERLYDLELGYRKGWKKGQLNVNFYYMRYEDQLALTGAINQDALPVRVNIDNSYRAGIELDGGVELAKGLNLSGAAAFSQNKIESFTEFIDNWDTGGQIPIQHSDTDLAFSPEVVANAELSYDILGALTTAKDQNLTLSLLGKYVGQQYIDNTSNENAVLDPYFFSDLRLEYNLSSTIFKELKLTFWVQNWLDARYSTNAWIYRYNSTFDGRDIDPYTQLEQGNTYNLTGFFPQAGRNYMFAVTVGF